MTRTSLDLDTRIRAAEQALFDRYQLTAKERLVQLEDPAVAVRILEFGADEAPSAEPPILLLHGIASINAVAAPLIADLAARRRVIAIDWPGHGLSGPIRLRRHDSVRDHVVAVIDGLRAALGLGQVDMVGHSMGAQFTLYYATRGSQNVRRIVLLGTPGAGLAGVRPVAAMRVLSTPFLGRLLLKVPMPMSAFKRNNDLMVGKGLLDRFPSEMTEIGYLTGRRPGFAGSVASFFRAFITPLHVRDEVPVTMPELAGLPAPTLFVWGEQDVFMAPDAAAASIEAIPDRKVVRVTGGHMPWLDQPEICGEAVSTFLNAP